MTKEDDSKEVIGESAQMLSQIFGAILVSSQFGGDPYLTGATSFFSQFINLRGKLKNKRVNSFVIELGKYFNSIDVDFDWENANSEDFSDFFEQLIINVSKTSSQKKRALYKKMILSQIVKPKELDLSLRYLKLIDGLEEIQIQLLQHWVQNESRFRQYRRDLKPLFKKERDYNEYLNNGMKKDLGGKKQPIIDKIRETIKTREIISNVVEEQELQYLINDLKSSYILEQTVSGNGAMYGDKLFEYHIISDFGDKFVEFVID